MRKKITAIAFLFLIFIFGILTETNSSEGFMDPVAEEGFTNKAIRKVETNIEEGFFQRYQWININGAFLRALNITYIKQKDGIDVYKLNNGDLMYTTPRVDVSSKVDALEDLNKFLEERDIKLIYVQLPYKIENSESMPLGAHCYASENANDLIQGLKEKGVPCLDLYEFFKDNSDSYQDLFFHTDHHWRPGTALRAANEICRCVHERWGFPYNEELLNKNNYNTEVYNSWFLGSMGKRAGIYYGGIDDFELLTPRNNTDFTFYAVSSKLKKKGKFEKALINRERIEPKDYFAKNTYTAYIGADYQINIVENNIVDNDTKVLLVRDSFSCALQPFLCMNYKNVTAIDLRYYEEMTLKENIDKNKYDLIIVAINPSGLEGDKHFSYG